MEAHVFPKNKPERADLIDGSIGEDSPFHAEFGYYAQGVGENTATLPTGWRDRLIPIRNANTRGATGLCLQVHDLLVSKYVAGREKDLLLTREAVARGLVDAVTLRERLAATDMDPAVRTLASSRIAPDFTAAGS